MTDVIHNLWADHKYHSGHRRGQPSPDCFLCESLVQVVALAEAAHRMDDWDFAALPHLEDGWRAIAQDDVAALVAELAALRAALVPFAAHKDTA